MLLWECLQAKYLFHLVILTGIKISPLMLYLVISFRSRHMQQFIYVTSWNDSIFFSCGQAALWMVFSVRLFVRPSVCPSVTPFWLCSHHRIIMKFSGVITKDKGKVHANGHGQRSRVKVTKVTTELYRFRTVTPVWIHIWWWNDTYSFMLLRRGSLLFSRSSIKFQGRAALKIVKFDPDWSFPDCNSSLNSPMATKCCTKLEVA